MFLPEPKTPWWAWLIAPSAIVLYLLLVSYVPESFWDHYPAFVLTYSGLILSLRALYRIKKFIDVRAALIDFRSLSREEQQRFLKTVWPSGLRHEYLQRVDMEETYSTIGKDASFPFPQAERRLHRSMALALCLFVAIMTSAVLFLARAPTAIRAVPAILAVLAAFPAAWVLGRLALLETTLHVTPFTASISLHGTRQQAIPFNQPLLLLNFPAKGYFELQAPVAGRRLRIHHARIGALHAYNLVSEYAALQPLASPVDAAT